MARPRCKINELVGESCRRQRRERSPYCTDKCKKRYHYIKNKKKKKPEPSGKSSTNRGQHYKDFVTLYAQKIEDKVFGPAIVTLYLVLNSCINNSLVFGSR